MIRVSAAGERFKGKPQLIADEWCRFQQLFSVLITTSFGGVEKERLPLRPSHFPFATTPTERSGRKLFQCFCFGFRCDLNKQNHLPAGSESAAAKV